MSASLPTFTPTIPEVPNTAYTFGGGLALDWRKDEPKLDWRQDGRCALPPTTLGAY